MSDIYEKEDIYGLDENESDENDDNMLVTTEATNIDPWQDIVEKPFKSLSRNSKTKCVS
jgi:hypothetical protein